MLQANRRRDPYPFTWEIPVALLATALLLAGLGVQLGRTLAYQWAGAGWHWPRSRAVVTSIPAILTGHPTAGLTPPPGVPVAAGTVYGWIIAVELLLAVAATVVAVLVSRRWGTGRMRGMATPAEARTTLGLRRLRAHRHVIRPDLYPARTTKGRP